MDTILHAPERIVPALIALIDQGLGKEHSRTPKGAEWGSAGNALKLDAGEGTGSQTFVHCKTPEDFELIYNKLTGELNLTLKEGKRTLPEFFKNGKGVTRGETIFFSVYLQPDQRADSKAGLLADSDSLGVIHNPNY